MLLWILNMYDRNGVISREDELLKLQSFGASIYLQVFTLSVISFVINLSPVPKNESYFMRPNV